MKKKERILHLEGCLQQAHKREAGLETRLREALDVPPPDHTEALIAARVELAVLETKRWYTEKTKFAKQSTAALIQEAIKMQLQEPGCGEHWKEFQSWMSAWRREHT